MFSSFTNNQFPNSFSYSNPSTSSNVPTYLAFSGCATGVGLLLILLITSLTIYGKRRSTTLAKQAQLLERSWQLNPVKKDR